MSEEDKKPEKISRYFSLGQQHTKILPTKKGVTTLDRNTLIKITAVDPRAEMFRIFGDEWSEEYEELPDMQYFPRGIFDINKAKKVKK